MTTTCQQLYSSIWGNTVNSVRHPHQHGTWYVNNACLPTDIKDMTTTSSYWHHFAHQCRIMRSKAPRCEHNTTCILTPRSLPGQMPHADLGALPTFLVYRYTMRLPGVRDLRGNKGEWLVITGERTVVVLHT